MLPAQTHSCTVVLSLNTEGHWLLLIVLSRTLLALFFSEGQQRMDEWSQPLPSDTVQSLSQGRAFQKTTEFNTVQILSHFWIPLWNDIPVVCQGGNDSVCWGFLWLSQVTHQFVMTCPTGNGTVSFISSKWKFADNFLIQITSQFLFFFFLNTYHTFQKP